MDALDLISEGRLKRLFRAKRKLNGPGLISHITQRSAGREPMFVEDDDYLYMMGLLKEIADAYSLKIFAVCLMPNHMHFLMSPEEQNLYDAMRDLAHFGSKPMCAIVLFCVLHTWFAPESTIPKSHQSKAKSPIPANHDTNAVT